MRSRFAVLLTLLVLARVFAAPGKDDKPGTTINYSTQIAPLVQKYCMNCQHGADDEQRHFNE